jgi:hypothetical protein
LLFRMPLALHRLVLSQGQTPIHLGSIQWGNVTPNDLRFVTNVDHNVHTILDPSRTAIVHCSQSLS